VNGPIRGLATTMASTSPGFATRFLQASGRTFAGLSGADHAGVEQPFHFVQMADTQLGMEALFQPKGAASRGSFGWSRETALLRRAAEEVNRLRPAFVIVCGDLVNEYPPEGGEGEADEEIRSAQERDFKEALDLVSPDISLICMCGNHDVGNRPNGKTIRRYTDNFGDDYFVFWCHGVRCLVLNSQLWKDDTECTDLREAMDRWLDNTLAAEEGVEPPRTLVFSHTPPFVYDADEEDGYFNLEGGLRRRLLARLADQGAVAWFCGHYHRNAGGVYTASHDRQLEVVVTGAVGTQLVDNPDGKPLELSGIGGHLIGEDVSGFRVVRVLPDRVEHEWKTFADLEWSRTQKL